MEKKWWILFTMCLLTVMINFDLTAINIAVPVIASEFQASLASMQWVINAYVLVSAMFQILGGRLGDTYGHRKTFLIGCAIFVVASFLAGFSVDENMLIICRGLQGLGLGISYPMTMVLTFAAFPKNQQAFALSFIIATMGIFLAIGPPLGGLIVHYIGWRWVFYINVPIGFLTLFLAWLLCEPHKSSEKHRIDYLGAFFLSIGLFGVILALNQSQDWGFSSPLFLISFFLGLAFLFFLYLSEKKIRYPIIEFALFRERNLVLHNIIRLIAQIVFIPLLFFIPIFLQNISGYTPVHSGLIMLFLTVIIGMLSPITGKWIDKEGDKLPSILATALYAIACVFFFFLEKEPNLFLIGTGLFCVGVGTSILFVSTVTGSVSIMPEEKQGLATGIIMTVGWVGCAFGIAIAGTIIALFSQAFLHRGLDAMRVSLSDQALQVLSSTSRGIAPVKDLAKSVPETLVSKLSILTEDAFLYGFKSSMVALFILSVIGILFSLFLEKKKLS